MGGEEVGAIVGPPAEHRVYGPPGTGKTTTLAELAEDSVSRTGPAVVTVLSLTNSAIQQALGRALPVARENVSTLHAACKRALLAREPAEEHMDAFREAHPARSAGLPHRRGEWIPSRKPSLYDQAQLLRQSLVPEGHWPVSVRRWYADWRAWCVDSGLLDYTGWLEAVLRNPSVLPTQEVVLVDEAQDHTPLQLAVLRNWPARQLVLIGDDDQCIYRWAGASPTAFADPTVDCVSERVLSQSWRIPAEVFRVAEGVLGNIRGRVRKVWHPRPGAGSARQVAYSLHDARCGLLPWEQIEAEGTTMLLTFCSYQLDDLVGALLAKRVPFHNPYRPEEDRWNPLTAVGDRLRAWEAGPPWAAESWQMWSTLLRRGIVTRRGRAHVEGLVDPWDLRGGFLSVPWEEGVGWLTDHTTQDTARRIEYCLAVRGQEPEVVVGTVHSVKGGEADTVLLFPDLSSSGAMTYLSHDGHGDTLRTYYVGVTRTRRDLRLATPMSAKAVMR